VDDDDEEAKKHTYPRRDTPVLVVKRKDDMFGLGYTPGMSLHEGGERRGGGANTGGAKNDSRLAGKCMTLHRGWADRFASFDRGLWFRCS